MGIYIEGLKKPTHCTECYFVFQGDCELMEDSTKYEYYKEQIKACPLEKIDLVRCRECKKHGKNSCPMTFTYAVITDDNNYCSYGERRADENALGR
jgi:hypothetical protein